MTCPWVSLWHHLLTVPLARAHPREKPRVSLRKGRPTGAPPWNRAGHNPHGVHSSPASTCPAVPQTCPVHLPLAKHQAIHEHACYLTVGTPRCECGLMAVHSAELAVMEFSGRPRSDLGRVFALLKTHLPPGTSRTFVLLPPPPPRGQRPRPATALGRERCTQKRVTVPFCHSSLFCLGNCIVKNYLSYIYHLIPIYYEFM